MADSAMMHRMDDVEATISRLSAVIESVCNNCAQASQLEHLATALASRLECLEKRLVGNDFGGPPPPPDEFRIKELENRLADGPWDIATVRTLLDKEIEDAYAKAATAMDVRFEQNRNRLQSVISRCGTFVGREELDNCMHWAIHEVEERVRPRLLSHKAEIEDRLIHYRKLLSTLADFDRCLDITEDRLRKDEPYIKAVADFIEQS